MPTGYTAGIIEGEITTFEQFATQCTRAFGATIHMRDTLIPVAILIRMVRKCCSGSIVGMFCPI